MDEEANHHLDRWIAMTSRAGVLAAQMAQVNADLVELATHLVKTRTWAGDGVRSPEHWLMVYCALSPARASEVIALAQRPEQMTGMVQRMRTGQVSLDQAAVVAQNVPDQYVQSVSEEMVAMTTVPQLRRALNKRQFTPPKPPEDITPYDEIVAALPEDERPLEPVDDGPELDMYTVDGRFHLRFEANALDGALVKNAIKEAKDALFTAGNTEATYADALLEVVNRSLHAVESKSRLDHYRIHINMDTDGNGWLSKKGALPQHLLRHVTCDGKIRPVWHTDAKPVSVGRSQRIVPERTRRLIEDRDGGCRYPGCTTTHFLENHHITHWSKGGTTDIDTLVSLCPRHHREHHQDRFSIHGDPTTPTGLVFKNPHGWPLTIQHPETVPPTQHPPPGPTPLRGTPLDVTCVYFEPNQPAPLEDDTYPPTG
ncbi:hypothetical protein GCM10028820_30760 [Tessaracoccus terricola]